MERLLLGFTFLLLALPCPACFTFYAEDHFLEPHPSRRLVTELVSCQVKANEERISIVLRTRLDDGRLWRFDGGSTNGFYDRPRVHSDAEYPVDRSASLTGVADEAPCTSNVIGDLPVLVVPDVASMRDLVEGGGALHAAPDGTLEKDPRPCTDDELGRAVVVIFHDDLSGKDVLPRVRFSIPPPGGRRPVAEDQPAEPMFRDDDVVGDVLSVLALPAGTPASRLDDVAFVLCLLLCVPLDLATLPAQLIIFLAGGSR